MGEYVKGYINHELIRKDVGSPAVSYIFNNKTESISIQNLGSTPIYYNFFKYSSADTGSISLFLDSNSAIDIDVAIGSISVLASGTNLTPTVQIIALY